MDVSKSSLHILQTEKTPSLQTIMKKVVDVIIDSFSKPKKLEQDRSLTDIKLIKTKKLEKEIKDAEYYIKNIFTFIENISQKSEEEILKNIQKIRGDASKYINNITSGIQSLKKEYPELKENEFLKKEEIKDAENKKEQLKDIEKVFQKLRMQQKKPFQKPNIKTMDELYELLNQEVLYTTKKSHEKKKTKITNISPNRKNNEIIIQMEIDTNHNKSKLGFARSFKGNSKDIIEQINGNINANIHTEEKTKQKINRKEIYDNISKIINDQETKIIEFHPKTEEKKVSSM